MRNMPGKITPTLKDINTCDVFLKEHRTILLLDQREVGGAATSLTIVSNFQMAVIINIYK